MRVFIEEIRSEMIIRWSLNESEASLSRKEKGSYNAES
jgi:hypothetical protein